MILAGIRASAVGIAGACVAAALFAVLSGFALPEQRLAEIVRTAVAQNQLGFALRRDRDEDRFTECALLEMLHLRSGGLFRSALDTKFLMRDGEHPCDTLRTLVLGAAEAKAALPTAVSYFNYPYGSRHLAAFVLSALDYGQATRLYRILSYGSVLLLFLAMLWRAPRTAILLAPVPLLLIGAFSLHSLGGNLGHAPGYFIGFLALAFFVAMPVWFGDFATRLGFAGALGVVAAHFDLLVGQIPILLALTILLNHFFYASDGRERVNYLFTAAAQGTAIFACFVAAYLALTLGRFGLLWLYGVDVSAFTVNLAARTANDIGIKLTFGMNLDALFAVRHQLTPGGARPASWMILAGLAGWIFVGLVGLSTLALRHRLRQGPLVDVLVLVAVSLGVLAWYWFFAAHTYVHVLLVVRLLALPVACGIAAALLSSYQGWRDRLPVGALAASLCAALMLAALMLHTRWNIGTAVAARFVDARADLVSCHPLGLAPDGAPDGIVAIRFERSKPPLAYMGFAAGSRNHVQLVRRNPVAVYHTGVIHNVLGIANEPAGLLLNEAGGGFSFTTTGNQELYAHFCRDGRDEARSSYELLVDGVGVPLAQN